MSSPINCPCRSTSPIVAIRITLPTHLAVFHAPYCPADVARGGPICTFTFDDDEEARAELPTFVAAIMARCYDPTRDEPPAANLICVHCQEPIAGALVGAGDGTGQKFAHPVCYRVNRLANRWINSEQERALREALSPEHGARGRDT